MSHTIKAKGRVIPTSDKGTWITILWPEDVSLKFHTGSRVACKQ